MNISSHLFFPRTVNRAGYYSFSSNPMFTTQSASYVGCTSLQSGDVYNSYQQFPTKMPFTGTWYGLRVYDSAGTQTSPYSPYSSGSGFQGDGLVKHSSNDMSRCSMTFGIDYYANGYLVTVLMWKENLPESLSLSLGNILSPSVVDELDEQLVDSNSVTEEIVSLLAS